MWKENVLLFKFVLNNYVHWYFKYYYTSTKKLICIVRLDYLYSILYKVYSVYCIEQFIF